jgi:molybdenum cofactor synthesis domain-containing protein
MSDGKGLIQAGSVVSVNVSDIKGVVKHPVPMATVVEAGIMGDAHGGNWHRQISLLARESMVRLGAESGRVFQPGEFAENITTEGLDLERVCLRDRLQIGAVVLEVTQIGKKCHGDGCAIFKEVGSCIMPKQGVFAQVVQGGQIRPGDGITHEGGSLHVRTITLSDRASRGEYADRSGPAIVAAVEKHFAGSHWRVAVTAMILPDDAELLRQELRRCMADKVDLVFTSGGTGIGPRDITPDTVRPLLSKEIPGIMEFIRLKYGQAMPSALLSRAVAGVMGSALVYTLPGSPRAVEEYLAVILPTLAHSLMMRAGIDVH